MVYINIEIICEEIKSYYYLNTELGRRERVLDLLPESIVLGEDFPYFSEGIRVINFDNVLDRFSIYIDVKFLFSDLYNAISNYSFFGLDAFHVISNELSLKDKIINYNNQLVFDIDLDGFIYNCDKGQYFLIELYNPILHKLKIQLSSTAYSIYYSINNLNNLDKEILILETLSKELIHYNLLSFKFTNCVYNDKMSLMKYFKVISKLFNKPKLVFVHVYHGNFIKLTHNEVKKLNKLFSSIEL